MQSHESVINVKAGESFVCHHWAPEREPRAVIALIHGFGEHTKRYQYLIDFLVEKGIAVQGIDLRGHGRSSGRRGLIRDWSEHRDAVALLLTTVRQRYPTQPLFLFGHSMGGLIALDYVLANGGGGTAHQLAGAIISAPWLAQAQLPTLIQLLARLMLRIAPDAAVDTRLDAAGVSRDPDEVQRYRDDPLNHSTGTARLGAIAERTINTVHARAGAWTLPLLLYHGAADPIIPIAGTERFHAALSADDVTFFTLPNGFHESHNDVDREELFARIDAWVTERLKRGRPAV